MKAIVALLAFAACASAGVIAPAFYDDHHHHHHHAPAVSPLYAVQPPIVVSKAVYSPAPVVKVLHAPVAPLVKTVAFGPVAYGAYGLHHHDLHHHHHGHFF